MPPIVGAGAAGAGAEFGLVEQTIECAGKGLVGEGLSTQEGFRFGGAEGRRAAWADGDVNILDEVATAFEPDRTTQDGQRHTLQALS